ncbi:Xanthine_oxidase / Xanthine dehydrogenase [Hexamita inflata]|uniref:Xanthine oxidase / Xanthine dehydrogenase n=1 Tax=Hexamita inflata TaxID=28002 RepID=A0AA86PBA7_9EUKA|nr:Xanthine oxidase / Xanthine dehydrogenase [Hexamita inflata]
MTVVFHLNGKLVQLYKPDPLTTLLEFLRQRKLYGTRVSDGNGIFGCDIVTVVSWDHHANKPVYKSIGALHYPLVYCHGKQIFTVEGIGNKQMLHPIQEQFLNCESFQCGYCAGGFTMAMYTLLRKDSKPSEASIMEALDGNMCRCTAFHPIAAAVASFSSDIEDKEMPICTRKVPFHPENEPEFPAELKNVEVFDYEHEQISPENGKKLFGVKYFTPKTIEELKNTLKENKVNVKMISGASSHQLTTICDNSKANEYTLLSLNNVVELQIMNMKEKHIELGSQLTYADVMEFSRGKPQNSPRNSLKHSPCSETHHSETQKPSEPALLKEEITTSTQYLLQSTQKYKSSTQLITPFLKSLLQLYSTKKLPKAKQSQRSHLKSQTSTFSLKDREDTLTLRHSLDAVLLNKENNFKYLLTT